MNHNPSSGHPYWWVRELVLSLSAEVQCLGFSYYRYMAQSLQDPRTEFEMSAVDFCDPDKISKAIAATPVDHELAFHSRLIRKDGSIRHIPLIDMSTASSAHLDKLRPLLGEAFSKFRWYRSGRSFHGYGAMLIDDRAWVATMGLLLLANQKGLVPTVDPRWIGHRLVSGYSALRWTKNTAHYIEQPRVLAAPRAPSIAQAIF